MTPGSFRFDRFVLDPRDRLLARDGVAVELNARYLDALTLLAREAGKLVSKERFHDEVWRGVPVTDEALTQCIKTLRRQLGDDAARPRFIETVPKHGYRFIAPVAVADEVAPVVAAASSWRDLFLLTGAGTIGAGIAGVVGGLFYGFAGAAQPLQPGMGAASVLLVLWCLTILMALIGGAGVAFGIAAAGRMSRDPWRWSAAGGAAGGLVVGGVVKLLGLDAFNLLLGRSPGDITGGIEGALLGGAVGLGGWLASRRSGSRRQSIAIASGVGGIAGALIPPIGGRLMGGSLDLLARSLPGSRLRLDHIGRWFGEAGFGPIAQSVTGALEGALFAGCIVGAMMVARRDLDASPLPR
ncbi:transcriptional regulator [Sphingomonas bacterium]|uniref:winged helix-turn-helix domain-containing protein n=1 Tax=Sphingomonas bacterium TaxID=1895847 RepID=UPI002618CCE9|nr:transcriptional regulator [Sphingomonas bacterium]MDB5678750.1 transcriptional regulator [Sphingomonas bacterium]